MSRSSQQRAQGRAQRYAAIIAQSDPPPGAETRGRADRPRGDHFCWAIQEKMAREGVITVPSASLSAGSFV